MITVKGRQHIRTSRNIEGHRSCKHSTGENLQHVEAIRLAREEERLRALQLRHGRRTDEWARHFEKVGGWQRVLPPSARK